MANIGYLANRITFPEALNAVIISTDGRPIVPAETSDTLWISPGERYGVLIEPVVDLTDAIKVSFVNMNTHFIENVQYIPVTVSGIIGIEEMAEESSIRIYPNPSSGSIHIASDGSPFDVIKVYDAIGNLVHVERKIIPEEDDYHMKVSLSKGFYTIELLHNNRISASLKLVKN